MADTQVLVAGAGPTGMTAAIELRRAGLDVRIVDKSDHMALHSQALVVQARTLEQFQRYGIAREAVERGHALRANRIFSEGKEIAYVRLDAIESRYPFTMFLPQSETEAILNRTMEALGVKTERGVELQAIDATADGVTATISRESGTEKIVARWLVACDGAHSKVRELCAIPFEGKGIPLSFFLADLVVEGDDKPVDELRLDLVRGDIVFMGPLSDRLTRVIIARHDDVGAAPSGKPEATIADFQRAIDQAGIRLRVISSEWMTPFFVNDRQAKHYRAGNVFLAGDASHIHSPIAGQGMNTGIQDAANLCWKLGAVAHGASDAEKLLDSYEVEREAVGKALLAFTERGLALTTTANPLLIRLRDALLPHLSKFGAVERTIAGFVSETAIDYRFSPVVQDSGGDGELRAGDRVPDVAVSGDPKRKTLLEDWTDSRHVAIAVEWPDASADLRDVLPRTPVISLRSEQLDADGVRVFGEKPKLVVMRPDGYAGFRGPAECSEELEAYLKRVAG